MWPGCPQFFHCSPSHLTISDKGTFIHDRVVHNIDPKRGLKRAPLLQSPKSKNPLFPRRCQDQFWTFGVLEFGIYGFLGLREIQKSKILKIQKTKIPKLVKHVRANIGFFIFVFLRSCAFCGCACFPRGSACSPGSA